MYDIWVLVIVDGIFTFSATDWKTRLTWPGSTSSLSVGAFPFVQAPTTSDTHIF